MEEAARFARLNGARTLYLRANRANRKVLRAYFAFGFWKAESIDWEFSPGFILNDYKMVAVLSHPVGRKSS